VWVVKLADRITNLEKPPDEWTPEKRRKYLDEARAILEQLRASSPLLEERFKQKLVEYEQYCPFRPFARHMTVLKRSELQRALEKARLVPSDRVSVMESSDESVWILDWSSAPSKYAAKSI
jgi:hypothetical protein